MSTIDQPSLSLELSRRFEAPPERVFDAWLDAHLCDWMGPPESRCAVLGLDPRVGGRYRFNMTMSDGRSVEVSGIYSEISRPRRLVFSWNSDYADQRMTIALTFRPDGGGTMMTLRQEGFPSAELQTGYSAGWSGPGGSFEKLAMVLARTAA